jgi:hypothetical protein
MKVGRPRKYKSADELYLKFVEYKEDCKNNPWIQVEYVGKDAKRVNKPLTVPFTKEGFSIFAGHSEWRTINDYKNESEEFALIVTRISKEIYNQKMTGASVGAFNSSIIASDLGLKNRTENTNKTELNISVSENLNKKLDDLIDGE